ncbi:tripartite tricarboxylate transporter substrate binding protein [Ramlibacter henchirensis]|uniref:Tripartite tricarboxylate transporter substrate binding protein n=1 Tax=Ramlibacter henchirensis TaxID=204072 RepID=A0A4Z0BXV2_9BURK|nr:tripartite tricarboxylate transporter substrate binding protein [Ramlibacter henchirensis]TFZ02759.1 tripartite tricarboxylate transporter substrate binding protein [Ramlibacter henchirensis]
MLKQIRRWAALFALASFALAGHAQEFPNKPVKILVPQTPGGASDSLARIVAQKLAEKWGQPVVVENRAGAGGNVGMEVVANSPADGYTLLMSYVGTHAINGSLYKKLPFDPEKDFAPVATLATLPFVVVVKSDAPFKTLPELVAAAKKSQLTYGSAGNGSVNHLLGEMFNAAAGVKLVHVPYRGAAPAMQDLMGGQINVVFTSLPSVSGHIKQGTLHPIAVTSAKRAGSFANIPTIAESGFKDFDVNPWFGLFAPAKVPPQVVRKINADVNEVLKSKDVVDKFSAQGAEPYITDPQQFAGVLKADIAKWSQVVKASGASVD